MPVPQCRAASGFQVQSKKGNQTCLPSPRESRSTLPCPYQLANPGSFLMPSLCSGHPSFHLHPRKHSPNPTCLPTCVRRPQARYTTELLCTRTSSCCFYSPLSHWTTVSSLRARPGRICLCDPVPAQDHVHSKHLMDRMELETPEHYGQ